MSGKGEGMDKGKLRMRKSEWRLEEREGRKGRTYEWKRRRDG